VFHTTDQQTEAKHNVLSGGKYDVITVSWPRCVCVQAVFGVLSAIEGCDAFADLVVRTDISRWYNAVKRVITVNAGQRQVTETQLHVPAVNLKIT